MKGELLWIAIFSGVACSLSRHEQVLRVAELVVQQPIEKWSCYLGALGYEVDVVLLLQVVEWPHGAGVETNCQPLNRCLLYWLELLLD